MLIRRQRVYDFVRANCRSFVLDLTGLLPRTDILEANPNFNAESLTHLLKDIRDYVCARGQVTSQSVKDTLDTMIQRLKYTFSGLAVLALQRWKDIKAGFKWFFTKLPQDALTWLVTILTDAVKAMTPIVKCVAGGATSAWNALCSDIGLKILSGVAIVAAVLGIA